MFCTFTPFFQDVDALKRRLQNNVELGLTGLYYDGPFLGYPHEHDYSTDGSRELIKSFDKQLLFDSGEGHMASKTNHGLHVAVKMGFDSFLTLGADEWIEGDIHSFYKNIKWEFPINKVPFKELQDKNKYNRNISYLPRLITMPMLVRLRDIHWIYFYNDKPLIKEGIESIEGITILHDDSIRTKQRNETMTKYQDWDVPRERNLIRDKYMELILQANYPPTISKSGAQYYTCGCIYKAGKWYNVCHEHEGKRI